jgi:hypothetical protein
MYNTNQTPFTTSAIDLLLASTLKAKTVLLTDPDLSSTVTGLPISSTATVYSDGGTFTGSATRTSLGTTTGALYQVTSAADGTVDSITVIDQGPNSAAGKTITFSEETLSSSFGNNGTYVGAVVNTTATTISLDNSNGGVNPVGGWIVGDVVSFDSTFTTDNGALNFGLQLASGVITEGSATGFTIESFAVGSVQTGTYVSGAISSLSGTEDAYNIGGPSDTTSVTLNYSGGTVVNSSTEVGDYFTVIPPASLSTQTVVVSSIDKIGNTVVFTGIFTPDDVSGAFGAWYVYASNYQPALSGDITYTPTAGNLELPSTNFTQQPVALYAGVGGDITLTLASDSTEVKFVGVVAGTFLDVLCTSVNTAAAGSPTSGLLALR